MDVFGGTGGWRPVRLIHAEEHREILRIDGTTVVDVEAGVTGTPCGEEVVQIDFVHGANTVFVVGLRRGHDLGKAIRIGWTVEFSTSLRNSSCIVRNWTSNDIRINHVRAPVFDSQETDANHGPNPEQPSKLLNEVFFIPNNGRAQLLLD